MTEEATTAEPTPAEAAQAELSTLKTDTAFAEAFVGKRGHEAQRDAIERKTALHQAAYGEPEAAPPALPERIQDALDNQSTVAQAAAQAMTPGQSVDDYSFTWADASTTDLETLQAQNTLAAEAAFDIGASPEYARTTVRTLEDMVARHDGQEPSMEQLQAALSTLYGGNADATVEAAKASLALMSPEARQWAIDAAGRLDAVGVAWFTGRLASVHKANAPKP